LDGLTVIPMLFPRLGGAMFGIGSFAPTPEYTYAIGLAAALMAGWTVLLVWGAVRPVERRGLLLITAVPVVAGLMAAGVNSVVGGFLAFADALPTLILQVVVIALVLAAWIVARNLARADETP